jgi:two-component system sensor histidine kinase AlgZ
MWFFVVAPPVLALLFDPDCVKSAGSVTRALTAITLYTVLTGLALHVSFEWLAARMRGVARALRIVAHALGAALVVAVITAPQMLYIRAIYPEIGDDVGAIVQRGIIVGLAYLALASFIGRLQRQAVRERLRAHEERTAALEARLQMLQAQMQPHFLFNSLNVCAGLVHSAPDAAEATLDRLAGFLRYALESTDRRLVPLEAELEAVRSYLEVQRQRFGDRLAVEIIDAPIVTVRTGAVRLPPMLLQPLVENAILHGLRGRADGGRVRVCADVSGDRLLLVVEDDGVGPDGSTHRGTGTGLRNVRERLRLVYGEAATLTCGRSLLGGFRAELSLPMSLEASESEERDPSRSAAPPPAWDPRYLDG